MLVVAFGAFLFCYILVEDVQITFDTDMMDEDEVLAYEEQQEQPQQNVDSPGLTANGVTVGFGV